LMLASPATVSADGTVCHCPRNIIRWQLTEVKVSRTEGQKRSQPFKQDVPRVKLPYTPPSPPPPQLATVAGFSTRSASTGTFYTCFSPDGGDNYVHMGPAQLVIRDPAPPAVFNDTVNDGMCDWLG
jgi:hypothetical protein